MPVQQPPITQGDPVRSSWDLEVTQLINQLEQQLSSIPATVSVTTQDTTQAPTGVLEIRNEGDTDYILDLSQLEIGTNTNLEITPGSDDGMYILRQRPAVISFQATLSNNIGDYSVFQGGTFSNTVRTLSGTGRSLTVTLDGTPIDGVALNVPFTFTGPVTPGLHTLIATAIGDNTDGVSETRILRDSWNVYIPFFYGTASAPPMSTTGFTSSTSSFSVGDTFSVNPSAGDRVYIIVSGTTSPRFMVGTFEILGSPSGAFTENGITYNVIDLGSASDRLTYQVIDAG